jgi:hypothetical protein
MLGYGLHVSASSISMLSSARTEDTNIDSISVTIESAGRRLSPSDYDRYTYLIDVLSNLTGLKIRQHGTAWSRAALPYLEPRQSDISDSNTHMRATSHLALASHATRTQQVGHQVTLQSSSRPKLYHGQQQ